MTIRYPCVAAVSYSTGSYSILNSKLYPPYDQCYMSPSCHADYSSYDLAMLHVS